MNKLSSIESSTVDFAVKTKALSVRSRHVLKAVGIHTREDALKYVDKWGVSGFYKLPSCGPLTLKNIMTWLGVGESEKPKDMSNEIEALKRRLVHVESCFSSLVRAFNKFERGLK